MLHACMLSRFSHVGLFATPWIVAREALLSIGFSKQEYWRGLSFPFPGYLTDPEIECGCLTFHVCSLPRVTRKPFNRVKAWKHQSFSRVRLFATPWTVAHQAPLSIGFSRQEYWSRFPSPSPRDLPDPGMEPRSPALQTDSLPLSHQGSTFNRVSTVKCL